MLDAILHGGSSVSLNLIDMASAFEKEKLLFKSPMLNGAVLFKFPNFDESPNDEIKQAFGGPTSGEGEYHPIETGIYLPYSTVTPGDGGCAIYMRQRNYQQLLEDYLGLSLDDSREGGEAEALAKGTLDQDTRLLSLMDTIPTLDPFLLKECFDTNNIVYDPAVLRLDRQEELEIRRLISEKISPIIQKAFEAGDRSMSSRERLLEALWNPALPEARSFVRAFGIAETEAVSVFSAWRGITFYQLQVRVLGPRLKEMIGWLKSKDSTPIDATINKVYMPQLQMFSVKINTLINQNIADMRAILQRYESAFETFIAGDPRELTGFLRSARKVYYILGYCTSSLNSACSIFSREIKPPTRLRINFEETNKLYTRLDTTLARKRELPSSL